MADFFRRLSEQVLNRAAVVQPLRASRFALALEMNLPTPTQLRQRLSASVHHDDTRGAAPAFAPRPLPAALVPPEAPHNTWSIPSLRQLGRAASAIGGVISPQRNPPQMPIGDLTTPDGEPAEIVESSASSALENQIIRPQTLGPFTAPTATGASNSESGDAALIDSALAIRNQNAPSAKSAIPPVSVPQRPNADVAVGPSSIDRESSLNRAFAVAAGTRAIALSTPEIVSPGAALPGVAADRRSGAQGSPILPETSIAPIPTSERVLGQPSLADPTSASLPSEGDVIAGSAAANNMSMAPVNLPGTPQVAATQSLPITVATDASRPVELEVRPVLSARDPAPSPPLAREKPSVTIATAEKMSRAVDRQPAKAPAPPVTGASAETAPTNLILPAPTPPVASPNTGTDRRGPPGKMLPVEESQLVPTAQMRTENFHEVLAAPVSVPAASGRQERSNVAIDQPVALLVSETENRGERAQRETTAPPVSQGNVAPMSTVSVLPQLDSARVLPKKVRPPAAQRFRPIETDAAASQSTVFSTQVRPAAKQPLSTAHVVSLVNEAAIQRDALNTLSPLVQPNWVGSSLTSALSSPRPSPTTPVAQPARSGETQAEVGRRRPVDQVLDMPTDEVGQPKLPPNPREAGIADAALLQPRSSMFAQQAAVRRQEQPAAEIRVRVTIGRVEVRQAAEPPAPSPRRRTTQPVLSLDAYLTRAQRGQA